MSRDKGVHLDPGPDLDDSPEIKKAPLLSLLFWPFLLILFLVSVLTVVKWFSSTDFSAFSLLDLQYEWVFLALALQFLVLLVTISCWQLNLLRHGLGAISYQQAAIMTGINSVGKYTPGKIWGLVARGAALLKYSDNRQAVISSSFSEQLALVHTGGLLALMSYFFIEGNKLLLAGIAVVSILSIFIVARSGHIIIILANRVLNKKAADSSVYAEAGFRESYLVVAILLTLIWLLSAQVLGFCIKALGFEYALSYAELLMVTTTAYISGFLAFFSLAGLGVREGIMVAFLGGQIGWGAALSVSILHRLVTMIMDVLVAGFSALQGKKSFIASEDNQ